VCDGEEAEAAVRSIPWVATGGKPVCPHCEWLTVQQAGRPNGASRYRRKLRSLQAKIHVAYVMRCRTVVRRRCGQIFACFADLPSIFVVNTSLACSL